MARHEERRVELTVVPRENPLTVGPYKDVRTNRPAEDPRPRRAAINGGLREAGGEELVPRMSPRDHRALGLLKFPAPRPHNLTVCTVGFNEV